MRLKWGFAAICVVVGSLTTGAHHSHGNYQDMFTDMEGVVKEIHFVVPHSWIYIEVKKPTGPEIWALEATDRVALEKMGVTKGYLKAGDTIKARCHLLRDGSRGCLMGFLKGPDGSIKDWDGGNAAAPTDF